MKALRMARMALKTPCAHVTLLFGGLLKWQQRGEGRSGLMAWLTFLSVSCLCCVVWVCVRVIVILELASSADCWWTLVCALGEPLCDE